jgi:hypothetical protein
MATFVGELPSVNILYACEELEREDRSGSTLFSMLLISRGDFLVILCTSLKVFFDYSIDLDLE